MAKIYLVSLSVGTALNLFYVLSLLKQLQEVLSPFSIIDSWSSKRLSKLPKLTQLLYDEAEILI